MSTVDCANIRQWEYEDADNQKWILQPVDSYPSIMASYLAITAKHSGQCLAVTDGNVVQQVYESENHQRMVLIPVGGGYFSISAIQSGQCLSIEGGSADGGANVVPEAYVGSDDQRWKVESIGDGYYKICAKHSYKCLAVSVDNVEQQEYAGKDYQRWKFEAKDLVTLYEHPDYGGKSKMFQGEVPYVGYDFNDIASSLEVPEGYTVILYEHPNYGGDSKVFLGDASYVGDDFNDKISSLKVLEIETLGHLYIVQKASGCGVIWEAPSVNHLDDYDYSIKLSGLVDNDKMEWKLGLLDDGYYYIASTSTIWDTAYISVYYQDEAICFASTWYGFDDQKWKLGLLDDGYYYISYKKTGKVIDGSTEDSRLYLNFWNESNNNQRWKLKPACGISED